MPEQDDHHEFDPQWYLAAYPDVAASGIDPWHHYDQFGRGEGRLPHALSGEDSERDLWSGYEKQGQPVLEAQAAGPASADRDMACWWLARWHGAHARWHDADIQCRRIVPASGPLPRLPGIGATLLAIQSAWAMGDHTRAVDLLHRARQIWENSPELDLMAANLDGQAYSELNRIWARVRVGRIRQAPEPGAPLDSIRPRRTLLSFLSDKSGPLVSIIIPAYNAAPTLPTALNSLLAQHWKSLEILVVDDGSTDDTLAVAQRFADSDARIRVLGADRNEGAYIARNRGMAAARGDFLTVHDADDWAHPDKIRLQVEALMANPDTMGSLSHWVRCSPDLVFERWRMEPEGLVHRNVSSLMIRRSVLDRLGYWDRVRVGADTEYYYRLMAAFGSSALTEVLPGVPLSLGRSGAHSLTGQSATHHSTEVGGLRADYHNAATRWQTRARDDQEDNGQTDPVSALYLPEKPDRRPFAIPDALAVGDPEADLYPDDLIRQAPVFDAAWYLAANEDVRHAGVDPAVHYLKSGAAQGRDPSPRFSTTGYRLSYLPDQSDVNPVLHFLAEGGHAAGYTPLPHFEGTFAGAPADIVFFGHQAGEQLFGAERCLLDMLDRFNAEGRHALVVLPHIGSQDYLQALCKRSVGVQIIPYQWRQVGRSPHPDTLAALEDLLTVHHPQEVHINTLVLDAPVQAAQKAGLHLTVHVHELPEQDTALRAYLGADASTIRGWLLDEADTFVVNSPAVGDWLAAPDRTTVISNQIDPALFDLSHSGRRPPCVAMISSNIAKKGVEDFVEMATHLHDMGVFVRCLLIGPESTDLAALRPLPDFIETPGYVDQPQTAIAMSDIVVSLSRFAESFGRTVLEAMAAGRPVVSYARGHPQILVEDGQSGFLVPADTPKAAANAVAQLVSDSEMMSRMSQNARNRAKELLAQK